jgi:S-adenosylmethionine:tRNA ribosyltransferase-isomerase
VRLDLFDYELPADLIAQEPAPERDAARLLLVPRATAGALEDAAADRDADAAFEETTVGRLAELLRPRDLLIVNDTRVVPSRLRGSKPTGGAVEILLLPGEAASNGGPSVRECLLSTSKGIAAGVRLALPGGVLAEVVSEPAAGRARIRFEGESATAEEGFDLAAYLERHGVMPLPPYIKRMPDDSRAGLDRRRYQTIYAARDGAVAAPTAGLHFTPALFESMCARGVETASVTLHVGPGTFQPVRSEAIEDHVVEPERFVLPPETSSAIEACRRRGGRVVAVGTTATRVLEGRARDDGTVAPGEGWCDLYIRPGHAFRVVDALLTNLHLPRSSLLILVAAFAGRERILAAYREAVRRRMRFYSYGDAMLLA